MLLKLQVNSQNIQSTQLSKCFKSSKSSKSCKFSNMSEHVETCLNLFRFYMIWIVMIHMILTDIWTCSNKHVKTCSDSIWYELLRFIWFSNMSELVQNQYDMNRYDSQTCLNLFRINLIWIDMILKHVWTCWNMSKLVKNQSDMNWYDSQTCLNML